jgi:hypothetical protein
MLREKKMKEIHSILPPITEVDESSHVVDVDEIVERNNITDLCTIEILYDITISKNMKMDLFAPKV